MSRIENVSSLSREDIACTILVSVIWGERLLYYVRSVLLRTPGIGAMAKPFISIVIVTTIIVTIPFIRNRLKVVDFVFVLGFLLLFLCHTVVYYKNYKYQLLILPNLVTVVLPMYLLGVVCDIDKSINILTKVSFAYVILGVFYYYYTVFYVGTVDVEEEDMGLAYQFLPHVLLLLYATLRRFNLWCLIGFLTGLFVIIGSGNRGSLLLIALFFTYCFLFGVKGKNKALKIVVAIVAVFVILNIDLILQFFEDILGGVGMSTRTINALLEGEFADDNGRFQLNEVMNNAKANSPFFGYGLCGDRPFFGVYCHNFYNEIIISFGPFFGGLTLMVLACVLIRAYLYCSNQDQKAFFFLLLCCGLIKLFISNSFLEERYFFFLLGYSVMIIRHNKPININRNEKTQIAVLANKPDVVATSV